MLTATNCPKGHKAEELEDRYKVLLSHERRGVTIVGYVFPFLI